MQCIYTSTGDYNCTNNSTNANTEDYKIKEQFTQSRRNKYHVLPGVLYLGNNDLDYDNPVRKPLDCLENCNITPGCKGFVLASNYKKFNPNTITCRLLSELKESEFEQNEHKTTFIKNEFYSLPNSIKGKCKSGYYDSTGGKAKKGFGRCGKNCLGGRYLIDNSCNCACQKVRQVTTI